ncbi:proteasome activator complex subunit 3-like [Styela clava]|uniref:proteasome activator complex subunit 3-like n=1 Tax=Styela clava TaxID=7725 RepID=UPI00193A7741|nr:proteasome activator complex subunit 3-like [Styela clava]
MDQDLQIKDKQLRKEISDFKLGIAKDAEILVNEFFPKKCIELDKFLKEDVLQTENVRNIAQKLEIPIPNAVIVQDFNNVDGHVTSPKKRKLDVGPGGDIDGTKVFSFACGPVPCNKNLIAIIDRIKPDIRLLMEKVNTVRMWVTHLIPKIEDGNNFGVSIQEDTLAELRQVESEAASFLDQISRYFVTRGKIITKVAKYPHVEDYRRFVEEIDEKEFLSLRLIVCELRNHYSILHDLILKNIEKIKKPRSSNIDGMY